MLHVTPQDNAPRSHREPDAYARAGMAVLGIEHLKPRARLKDKRELRYGWFAGRGPALRAVGRVAEEQGPIAARLAADAVLARVDEGLDPTSRAAAWVVKEAAYRLSQVRQINGSRS